METDGLNALEGEAARRSRNAAPPRKPRTRETPEVAAERKRLEREARDAERKRRSEEADARRIEEERQDAEREADRLEVERLAAEKGEEGRRLEEERLRTEEERRIAEDERQRGTGAAVRERPKSHQLYLDDDVEDWLWEVAAVAARLQVKVPESAVARRAFRALMAQETPAQVVAQLSKPIDTRGKRGRPRR